MSARLDRSRLGVRRGGLVGGGPAVSGNGVAKEVGKTAEEVVSSEEGIPPLRPATPLPPLPSEKGSLREWDRREDVAALVAGFAGLPAVEGERADWTVGEATLRVSLWREPERGLLVYRVHGGWPSKPARKSIALVEAYAAAVTRTLRAYQPPELARWKARMLIEFGLVGEPAVRLAPLPADAPAHAHTTWALVARLLAIRALTADDPEFAFSAPWIASYFTVDENTVRRGKAWLERHGYLSRTGLAPSRHAKDTVLWTAATHHPGRATGAGSREENPP